jgi:sugar/nucleoside kinase (ribokinase family)
MHMNAHPNRLIVGVGSPIVDIIAHIDAAFLAGVAGAKGGMELMSAADLAALLKSVPGKLGQSPGGSAGNTCFALARLGNPTTFVGKIGNDTVGDFYMETFAAYGGETRRFKTGEVPTGRCLSLVTPDGQRTMRTDLGAAMTLAPDEISPQDFAGCAHAHIEGYLLFNERLLFRVLDAAKTAGCTVSLDLASFEVVNAARHFLPSLLKDFVDVVFANEEEAAAFVGDPAAKPQEVVKILAQLCKTAAVKVGAQGAWMAAGVECVHVPAQSVKRLVDTTGAGDFWAAGFLYGWMRHCRLEECGFFGSLLGAAVVQVDGTTLEEVTWETLQQRIVM